MLKIKPDSDCKFCNGTGKIWDVVDYYGLPFPRICDCVREQIPEHFNGEIEIDSEDENK